MRAVLAALLLELSFTAHAAPCTSSILLSDGRVIHLPMGCNPAEAVPPTTAGGGLLVFRVRFGTGGFNYLATPEATRAAGEGAASLIRTYSGGKVDIGPVVSTPLLSITKPAGTCNIAAVRTAAVAAARAQGIEPNDSAYWIFLHANIGCPLSGMAAGKRAIHIYGVGTYQTTAVVYAHEMLHPLGFGHVTTGKCGSTSCTVGGQYSDPMQIMGATGNKPNQRGWPSAYMLERMGWLNGELVTVTAGEHELRTLEEPGARALKVRGNAGIVFYVELRKDEAGPTILFRDGRPGIDTSMALRALLPGKTYKGGGITITALARDRVQIH